MKGTVACKACYAAYVDGYIKGYRLGRKEAKQ